eukprot:scaffold10316_cov71-Cyclotella_meneghiniana.AAC.11
MSAGHNYSETQLKILAILPHITGTLSVLGSSFIICDIWKNRSIKMKRPYYRILLGLSLCDFVASTSFALSTIPMPVDTPGVFGAKGTTQTCTAAGGTATYYIQSNKILLLDCSVSINMLAHRQPRIRM